MLVPRHAIFVTLQINCTCWMANSILCTGVLKKRIHYNRDLLLSRENERDLWNAKGRGRRAASSLIFPSAYYGNYAVVSFFRRMFFYDSTIIAVPRRNYCVTSTINSMGKMEYIKIQTISLHVSIYIWVHMYIRAFNGPVDSPLMNNISLQFALKNSKRLAKHFDAVSFHLV